jgi:hypothetical protein
MAATEMPLGAKAPACCNGAMCPMHQNSARGGCDMDMSHSGVALKSCPDQSVHYTASFTFVRVAPPAFLAARVIEAAPVFVLAAAPLVIPSIDSPPPRFVVA